MENKKFKYINKFARDGFQELVTFLSEMTKSQKVNLPEPLLSQGVWMANSNGSVLGFYYLKTEEQERVKDLTKRNLPPFPGFLISESLANDKTPVGFSVGGENNYFFSNHTSNCFAYKVSQNATFLVVDHFHNIKDSVSGETFNYPIDVAFIIDVQQGLSMTDFKSKLNKLLLTASKNWGKFNNE